MTQHSQDPALDIGQVRAQFPALSAVNSRGIVPAYFDGPGGTQVPRRVLDAMADYLVGSNSNIEGEYEASIRTDELIARARTAGGAVVNGDREGIAFGQNATTLNFLLTRAFGRLPHRAGALGWVDAVHYAPHRRIDVQAIGCDVLLCSPYKFFGPHSGMAWIRPDLAAAWPAERGRPAGDHPAGHRFETGTLSHEALAGFVAAVDYLRSLGGGGLDQAYAAM